MPNIIELETERLVLRQWKSTDFEVLSKMGEDPRVMEFFPSLLSKRESQDMALKCQSLIKERGWGFWALEDKASEQFIGFAGLHIPTHDLPFTPCVEIGWRLAPEFWGQGLVTEAANSALKVAFSILNFDEIVSFTSVDNVRSQAVMQRLGMIKQSQNFEHPALPVGHPLREHVLYKLERAQWLERK